MLVPKIYSTYLLACLGVSSFYFKTNIPNILSDHLNLFIVTVMITDNTKEEVAEAMHKTVQSKFIVGRGWGIP